MDITAPGTTMQDVAESVGRGIEDAKRGNLTDLGKFGDDVDPAITKVRDKAEGQLWQERKFNGGRLMRGNVGNRGGGAVPKLTAEKLAQAAADKQDEFLTQRDSWLAEAKECLDDHRLRDAALCQKQANEIQSACIQYGVGSKSTNILGISGTLEICQAAYEASADLPTFLKALEVELKWDKP